ncbi:ABC transporter substrate-binding protein [Spongiactinospora sp. TRM90649]|uniref:ABC transporter substrate-binding protein n=1 Tax=Spongiactinospora sp. TRM90649 TaxID=3031114 RepID=UPI0023F8B706|nr:ABC transporter substrate-binding protein [Spongiactinospora sp. TRM90649]MDF5753795.1 ABC transporter substrate-binding protein [Spongiactinospora sp. TRM90649]
MRKRSGVAVAAIGTVLALGLSACGGGGGNTPPAQTGGGSAAAGAEAFNAALGKVFNPSTAKGGTLKMAHEGTWDSLDPGDTYYGYSFNFVRLYGRALLMFKSAPGKDGNTLVPDLAESLGTPGDGGKTWTYKLRKGVKFEDGTEVTSKDVAYAVARSFDKETLPHGPGYLNELLDWPKDYKGAFKEPDKDISSAIETPDDQTIVFKLKAPFSSFDYIVQMPMTMPVPKAKDTGSKYQEHVISTGPYMFDTNELEKSFALKRNPNWDPATDPNRPALPERIEVQLNANADDIDNRLISGDLHVAVTGLGLGQAARTRVLNDPAMKSRTDNPQLQRLWYVSIIPDVAPFDKIDCRKAVEWAADRTSIQRAYGGPNGGDIATGMIPPSMDGSKKLTTYATPGDKGDVEKAKQALAACGQPNGFEANISYRAERPAEKAFAESMQQSLARVGIKLTLKPFPDGDYFNLYAGKPAYVKENKLGLAVNGWGSDYPETFGFMQAIVDSRTIRDAGNYNLSIKIPEVDQNIDKVKAEQDAAARTELWSQIDQRIADEAVTLPGVHARSILMRGKGLTNVFVSDSQQMYDYVGLGVQQ